MTDVVDSTMLVERLGDAAAADFWAEHDRLTRQLLQESDGTELQRSDGYLLQFRTMIRAADFAERYHEGLGRMSEPVRARVGIHQGSLEVRDAGDGSNLHSGIAIPLVARLMSLAIGGQTLISASARDAVAPSGRRISSHGHWRLKGVEEAFEIFEIGGDAAPWTPPPDVEKVYRVVRRDGHWMPRRELRFNLPAERNEFVGRRTALRSLADRIRAGARFVSILGPGGTGKTRLVQHFGWNWLGDFPGGIWFCDLSLATSHDGLVSAVAKGLDVPLGGSDPVDQLKDAIAGRGQCLVVLDNFEQVSHLARGTLDPWIDGAPLATFVVTTRSVLGLDGEAVLVLTQMGTSEGEELFVRRARAAKPDFIIRDTERSTLTSLIRLLEGLPLAIELAAARVRIMSVAQIVARMQERFSLLSSRQGRAPRQGTLKATLDWSWDLLTESERRTLFLCSVFEGGFTLDAFEHVVALSPGAAGDHALDSLQGLINKSWLPTVESSRFSMLSSVQEYVFLKLDAAEVGDWSGSALHAIAGEAHWRYFASLRESEATRDRCADLDNLVVATRNATAAKDANAAVAALMNTWGALRLRGPFSAVQPLLTELSKLEVLDAGHVCRMHYVAGAALKHCGEKPDASREFEEGLSLAEQHGDVQSIALLACAYGELLTLQCAWPDAQAMLDRSIAAAESSFDVALVQAALNALGGLAQAQARHDDALAFYGRALRLAIENADARWEGGLLGNLGTVLYLSDKLDEARDHYERALRIADEMGDRRWAGNTRCNLGLLLQDLQLFEESRQQLAASLVDARELGHQRLELTVLWNLGLLAVATGDWSSASRDYRAAVVVAHRIRDENSAALLNQLITDLTIKAHEVDRRSD